MATTTVYYGYVLDRTDNQFYVYNLTTLQRDATREWSFTSLAGVEEGAFTDGTHVWILSGGRDPQAYLLSNGNRVTTADIDIASSIADLRGGTVFENHAYLLSTSHTFVYVYSIATGNRVTSREFNLHTSNPFPRSITNDGTYFYVGEATGGFRAYTTAGVYTSSQDISATAENGTASGAFVDPTHIWAIDDGDDEAYAYRLSNGNYDSSRDIDFVAANTNVNGGFSVQVIVPNTPPTVTINTPAQTVNGNTAINLSATATDTDTNPVDTLTPTWSATGGTFNNAGILEPTWTAPRGMATQQQYTLTLSVSDGEDTTTATRIITVRANEAPSVTVNTSDMTVDAGDSAISLIATVTDRESDSLTYTWADSIGGGTFGNTALEDTTWTPPTATPDKDTAHVLTLTANDGLATGSDSVTITVRGNMSPTASITTTAQTVNGNAVVALDATADDPDGSVASTLWTATGGTFADAAIVDAVWTAPAGGDAVASYTLTFTVTDNLGATASAEVVITVRQNQAPTVVIAGGMPGLDLENITITGNTLLLAHFEADPTARGNGQVNLWDDNSGGPADQGAGTLLDGSFNFMGALSGIGAIRRVGRWTNNERFILNSTNDGLGNAFTGTTNKVTLYREDSSDNITSFTVDQRRSGGGTWVDWWEGNGLTQDQYDILNAIVTGDECILAIHTGTIDHTSSADQTVDGLTLVNISATASDVDGTIASTEWTASDGTFADDSALTTTWTAPAGAATDTPYTLTITATDNQGLTGSAEVTITVRANLSPTVTIVTAAQTVNGNAVVSLDATVTDDGTIAETEWTALGGTFADSGDVDTTWTAPAGGSVATAYTLTLTATDDQGAQASANVIITVRANQAPSVTIVTAAQDVAPGGQVSLDATVSDPDGSIASTTWTATGGTFADASAVDTTWTAPIGDNVVTPYTLTLTAVDDQGLQTARTVIMTVQGVPNVAPVVTITTGAMTVAGGAQVSIAATASDSDGTITSLAWTATGGSFNPTNTANTTWTAPAATFFNAPYTLTLTATDDDSATNSANVIMTVMARIPDTPTGLAAPTVVFNSVTLTWDDPSNTSITSYQILRRDVTAGETELTVLADNTGSSAVTYTDATVSATNEYEYAVRARNSAGLSTPSSTVSVTTPAIPGNFPPVVTITTLSQTVQPGGMLALDATVTDQDGTVESTLWTATGGTFADDSMVDTTWTAPTGVHVETVYTVTLTATDDEDDTGMASIMLTVPATANVAPTVSITTLAQNVTQNTDLTINATAADSDGTISTISWTGTGGVFNPANSLDTVWTAPAAEHTDTPYTLTLTVTDDDGATGSAEVIITVTGIPNVAPMVAIATAPQMVAGGDDVSLDATVTDSDGTIASTTWSATGGTFDDTSAVDTTWTAPAAEHVDTQYTLTLTAVDDDSATNSANVIMTVQGVPNVAPTATISTTPKTVDGNSQNQINATAMDSDGTVTSVAWTATGGTFNNAAILNPIWTSPAGDPMGDTPYTLTLTVTDDDGATGTAMVVITVAMFVPNIPPTVTIATPGAKIAGGSVVALDATVTDSDGTIASTLWSALGGTFEDAAMVDTNWTAPFGGATDAAYILTLTATDNDGDTGMATVTFTVAASTGPSVPDAPTLVASSATALVVTWTEPNNQGSAITSYTLRHRQVGTNVWTTVTGLTALTYTITGLTRATQYEAQVLATNARGSSAYSDSGTGTTLATIPSEPGTVVFSDIRPTSATASWAAPADDGGSTILSYDLRYREVSTSVWKAVNAIGALFYNITGLTENTSYEAEVRATNAIGNGAYTSTRGTFTTPQPFTPPAELEPFGSFRVELYEESGGAFVANTSAVMNVVRSRILDEMGSIRASFPAVHVFADELQVQRELRFFHDQRGYLGTYVIKEVDRAVHEDTPIVSIVAYDLLVDLFETNTFINRNYNGLQISDILSNTTNMDAPDGLLRGTRFSSVVDSGLGEFVVSYNGESRLSAVAVLADRLKQHFRLQPSGPGTSPVLEFGAFGTQRDLRLVGVESIPDPFYDTPDLLPIISIDDMVHSQERTDYLLPIGTGAGTARLTLEHATASDANYPIFEMTLPDDTTGYYVKQPTAPEVNVATAGGSQHFFIFEDSAIRPVSNAPGDVTRAADALYKTAVENLKVLTQSRTTYQISVGGALPADTSVTIGDSINVEYRGVTQRYEGGTTPTSRRWVDISGSFFITAINETFVPTGGVETSINVSPTGEDHLSDKKFILDLKRRADVLEKYVQLSANVAHLNFDAEAAPVVLWQDNVATTNLDGAFNAGATQITVDDSVGLSPGEYIRVGDRSEDAMEVYRITARTGNTLTLDTGLLTDHANNEVVADQRIQDAAQNILYVPIGLEYYDLQRVRLRLTTRQGISVAQRVGTSEAGGHEHVLQSSGTGDAGNHSHGIHTVGSHSHGSGSAGSHSHGIHTVGNHSHGVGTTGSHSHSINSVLSHNHSVSTGSSSTAENAAPPQGHTHLQVTPVTPTGNSGGHDHSEEDAGNHTHSGGTAGGHTHGQDAAGSHAHSGGSAGGHTHGEDATGNHSHSLTNARTDDQGNHSHPASVSFTASTAFPALIELWVNNVDVTRSITPSTARGPYGEPDSAIENFIIDLTPYFHDNSGNLLQQFHKIELRPRAGFGEIIANVDLLGVIQAVVVQ